MPTYTVTRGQAPLSFPIDYNALGGIVGEQFEWTLEFVDSITYVDPTPQNPRGWEVVRSVPAEGESTGTITVSAPIDAPLGEWNLGICAPIEFDSGRFHNGAFSLIVDGIPDPDPDPNPDPNPNPNPNPTPTGVCGCDCGEKGALGTLAAGAATVAGATANYTINATTTGCVMLYLARGELSQAQQSPLATLRGTTTTALSAPVGALLHLSTVDTSGEFTHTRVFRAVAPAAFAEILV